MNGRGLLMRLAVALGFCSTMLILQVMALIAARFGGRGNILYTISVIFLAMQCFLSSYCDGKEGISIWWQSNIGNVIISVVICVVMFFIMKKLQKKYHEEFDDKGNTDKENT